MFPPTRALEFVLDFIRALWNVCVCIRVHTQKRLKMCVCTLQYLSKKGLKRGFEKREKGLKEYLRNL